MELRNITPVAAAAQAKPQTTNTANQAERGKSAQTAGLRQELTGPLAQKVLEDAGIKPVEIDRYRVQLDIDGDTGRVVAEVREKESGDLVAEVPSRTLLRQAAMLKETLGMILDTPA